MKPLSWLLLLLILLWAPLGVFAEDATDQVADPQQEILEEFLGVTFEKDRGAVAVGQILGHSFAARLQGAEAPLTPDMLSALGAAYDPMTDTPLNAGMLYFHLALPIALLRELGGGGNEILARIIESRIRWLAGDTAAARFQIEDLLIQVEALGMPDDQMISVLADAAVLAWRDGDTAAARVFLTRAQTCGTPRCPSDFVFEWLGPDPKPNDTRYDAYDAEKLRDHALAGLTDLVANPQAMREEVAAEWRFMTGQWGDVLDGALARAGEAGRLTQSDRRQIRGMADRMAARNDMVSYLLGYDSVAGEVSRLTGADGALSAEKLIGARLSYLGARSLSSMTLESWPVLNRLYLASDRPGDVIVARTIEARLVLMDDDPRRALRLLTDIVADARQQGFTDGQLFSVLMDQWAAAILSGTADVAVAADAATAACRQATCPEDLVQRLADRYAVLPEAAFPAGYEATVRAATDAFLQETFPGDFLMLADLYRIGGVAGQNRPIDAARDDATSFDFAMQARDLTAEDLVRRANETMDSLIVAGLYHQAAAIGDRAETRLLRDGALDEMDAGFLQKRARAAFRLGEARTDALYAQAVDLIMATPEQDRSGRLVRDLTLDLLDTGFDEPLLRLAGGDPAQGDIRARVFYRQGKYADATRDYRAYRRHLEVSLVQPTEVLSAMYAARARIHLRGQNLDAYLAAQTALADVEAERNFPQDHPLVYATNALLRAAALQEAYYRTASGDVGGAERLTRLGQTPDWPAAWPDMDRLPAPETVAYFTAETTGFATSMSPIQTIMEFRDTGNYQGAASAMRSMGWLAQGAALNGDYVDAQTLWQMAFTFVRGGETAIAFDLMDRAARIAATLSFKGASRGMLQVLERDRWRYLLFVDIAWAALSGQTPDDMLVVSRY